jgi:hypothetical protein
MLYVLYLDFDGVIWDTWPSLYRTVYENDLELYNKMINKITTQEEDLIIGNIFRSIDWEILLKNTGPLNNSLRWIKELQKDPMLNMASLTHCNTDNEAFNKTKLLAIAAPDLKVIPVMKPKSKAIAVDPRGAILVDDFGGNLREWQAAGGIGVKFSLVEEDNNGFYNITSLKEMRDVISLIKMNDELKNEGSTKTLKRRGYNYIK